MNPPIGFVPSPFTPEFEQVVSFTPAERMVVRELLSSIVAEAREMNTRLENHQTIGSNFAGVVWYTDSFKEAMSRVFALAQYKAENANDSFKTLRNPGSFGPSDE